MAPWLRALASIALLAAVLAWMSPAALRGVLIIAAPAWLLPAILIGLLQPALSAWRWRLTAGLLGVPLPFGHALREYWLGNVLNQVLPGGVAGDITRAWRHARGVDVARAAWHAVLIERTAGQVVLLCCAILTLPLALSQGAHLPPTLATPSGTGVALGALIVIVSAALLMRGARNTLGHFGRDAARALIAPRAWPLQLIASLTLVASYLGVYVCCARALGVQTDALTLVPLVCWVLVAMALPLSLAGWGIREGAAAGIWLLAGLPVAQGVAISLLYGVVVFACALPGAWLLLAGRGRRPDSGPAG